MLTFWETKVQVILFFGGLNLMSENKIQKIVLRLMSILK